jgi:PRC-barrel domain protein
MDHPKPGLKYVDAKDLDDSAKKFTGVPVLAVDGEKLGEVEGFVMDVGQGRPRHVAVAAGWFIHKHFLLPIGHVALSDDGTALVADITKERVKRFPGFDKDEFVKLDAADIGRLDVAMTDAWAEDGGARDLAAHYNVPAWWQEDFYRDRVGSRR